MKKRQNGITLIALAITIIILLILAGITIGTITSKNGAINQANEAKALGERESIIEKIEADLYSEKIKTGKTPGREELIKIINDNNYGTVSGGDLITSDENCQIKLAEIPSWSGYVKNGLILHYDGINNIGAGDSKHSTTTTIWKDLSGNGNDGTINGATINDNYILFDGEDDWINCGEINNDYLTLEVLFEIADIGGYSLIGNWEVQGGGLSIRNPSGKLAGYEYINDEFKIVYSEDAIMTNKKCTATLTYDGTIEKLYLNGILLDTYEVSGVITGPNRDTVMSLGVNPKGNLAQVDFLKGKIYSARIYNKALTDDEVKSNYETDKTRFNIE